MNWLYPLLALGTLTALCVLAYLYVRWKDMKAMREFARRYREAEQEGITVKPSGTKIEIRNNRFTDSRGNDISHLVDP